MLRKTIFHEIFSKIFFTWSIFCSGFILLQLLQEQNTLSFIKLMGNANWKQKSMLNLSKSIQIQQGHHKYQTIQQGLHKYQTISNSFKVNVSLLFKKIKTI